MKNRFPALTLMAVALALTTSAWAQYKETVLYNFTFGNDGGSVQSLIQAPNGDFYGTALGGPVTTACPFTCGVVFKLSKSTGHWVETVIHSFKGGYDGNSPWGIVMDAQGNIYGNVTEGFGVGPGRVFKLSPKTGGGWGYQVIYIFGTTNNDGLYPEGSPVLDSNGNLYGTTYNGGLIETGCPSGCGIVYELSPTDSGFWTETIVHDFIGGSTDGALPTAGMTFDSAGNLFGVTGLGGSAGAGTVFELTPSGSGWTESLVHAFANYPADGAGPVAAVTIDAAGNIYGTTYSGGAFTNSGCFGACGAVYEISPVSGGGWTEKLLHSFNYTTEGALSRTGVALDSAGHLYGLTFTYPNTLAGAAYKLSGNSAGQWKITVLYVLGSASGDGGNSVTTPILDAAGDLYAGTEVFGAHQGGNVFKLSPPPTGSAK